MAGSATDGGDLLSVVAVNAFGAAGVMVSLFDFFGIQKGQVLGVDPIGVAVLALGLAVEFSGRRALGKNFTVRVRTTEGQRLVQSGPYRFIRHPLYLGIILVWFSGPLAWYSAYGALVALPMVPVLLRRISLEEKAMSLRFGQEYASYAEGTKRLVPLIY